MNAARGRATIVGVTRLDVLHVTPYAGHAWAFGGIPRVVAAETGALAARGLGITVAATDVLDRDSRAPGGEPGRPRRPHSPADHDGVTVRLFPNLSHRLAARSQLYLPLGLDRWLRGAAAGFAVGHLHGCHNLPGVLAARRLGRAGVPWVIQPNGTAPRHERRLLAKAAFDTVLGQRALLGAAAVIAVSEAERRQLETLGVPRQRIRLIPNPVPEITPPTTPEVQQLRTRWRLRETPLVTYLGQLSPRKRVEDLVRAFAGLSEGTAQLVVAGPDMGSRGAAERLAASLGVAERTVFTGVLAGGDRLALLAASSVVVYPTQNEIFGLVPLEALQCGTPVVVADDCGCGEVVAATGGGLVVPLGDVAALTSAIAGILAVPEAWREPVTEAARRIRTRFAPAVVAAGLEALYRELTDAAGGAGRGAA